MADALALVPADIGRRALDLPRLEPAIQAFIETEEDSAVIDEARRRLGSASAYYDRDSDEWKVAERLTRRAERRMAELLPPKQQGKPLTHESEVPVRHATRREWELMAAADGLFDAALAKGKVTRRAVVRHIQEAQARDITPQTPTATGDAEGKGWTLLSGDFRTRLVTLQNAADLIVTDPPYPSEMASLWTDLAEMAARALRPGGILLALSGKIELADRMDRLGRSLRYGWMYAEPLERGGTRILGRHVSQEWKPWLAYTKGDWPSGRVDWHGDLLSASVKAKDFRWQQGGETAQFLISVLCPEDGVVIDPFAGHGTYGLATVAAGRTFIGCEMDAARFDVAAQRLAVGP